MNNDVEQMIQDKNLNAPRVTPADIEAAISAEFYFTADDAAYGAAARHERSYAGVSVRHDDNAAQPSLELLTFCVLVLKNGFTVTGESACASPKNFDAEIGRKVARGNAISKIWPLLGYELKSRLHNLKE